MNMNNFPLTQQLKRRIRPAHAVAIGILAASCFWGASAHAQTYMNMTVGGQFAPGVYGQVTFGNAAPPPVVNVQPVIVGNARRDMEPIYMHVPDEETRHWHRYCRKYDACNRPVHFVRVEENNRWWEGRGDRGEVRAQERHQDNGDHRDINHDRGGDRRDEQRWNQGDERR